MARQRIMEHVSPEQARLIYEDLVVRLAAVGLALEHTEHHQGLPNRRRAEELRAQAEELRAAMEVVHQIWMAGGGGD